MASEIGYHRIRRAKSAPSVKKRRQIASTSSSLDSEIARHHATTAASLAMAQAKDRMANAPSQKTARSSNEESGTMPSVRAIRRRPSAISLARERSSTGHSHNTVSDNPMPIQQAYDRMIDRSSSANMSSVSEFKGFGFDEELSAPSSYRRLRKSRSMFNTRSMRSLRNSHNSEEVESPSLRHSTESTTESHRSLRHSLSFFNGASQSIRRMKSHGAISSRRQNLPKLADDSLLPQMPPLPVSSEGQPVRKQLRTTVRTLRELSPDAETLPASNGGKLHSKARSFSITIKKRLKRAFGIPAYAESRSSEGHSSTHGDNLIYDSPSTIDGSTRPSLHETKSSESIATSASRVTSWTNSTAGNTVRTRHTIDRHSLSTIEEGGDISNQQPPAFSEIYENDNVRNRRGKKIDSQRVYSALMRHIDETATRDGERVISSGTVRGSPVVVGRSPSVHTQREHGSIHKVPSDLSMKTAQTSFLIEPQVYGSQSPLALRSQSLMTERAVTPLETKHGQRPSSVASSRLALRDTRSLFFPSGASPKLKTPSPYRAAMNSNREVEDDSSQYTPSIIIRGTDNDKMDSPSPSVYSRTPSGHAASREHFDYEPEEPVEPGMVTIFDAQVPYRSPKRHGSQATEAGPRSSGEWRHWMNYQMDSIGNFNLSNLGSQREHHREDSECDGEPIQRSPTENTTISNQANSHRDDSLSRLRQIYTSRQVSQITDTEITAQGQNNFSRPLSRQSLGSLRTLARQSSFSGKRQYLFQGTDLNRHDNPSGRQTDLLFNESPEGPVSPSRRQSIRAAREARLSRGNARRNTLRQYDDQQDAKAVQFRSIREAPSAGKRNKENEVSPNIMEKLKSTGLEDLHMTIDSKRMVDLFLDSRRGRPRQNSLASEGIDSVFI